MEASWGLGKNHNIIELVDTVRWRFWCKGLKEIWPMSGFMFAVEELTGLSGSSGMYIKVICKFCLPGQESPDY